GHRRRRPAAGDRLLLVLLPPPPHRERTGGGVRTARRRRGRTGLTTAHLSPPLTSHDTHVSRPRRIPTHARLTGPRSAEPHRRHPDGSHRPAAGVDRIEPRPVPLRRGAA